MFVCVDTVCSVGVKGNHTFLGSDSLRTPCPTQVPEDRLGRGGGDKVRDQSAKPNKALAGPSQLQGFVFRGSEDAASGLRRFFLGSFFVPILFLNAVWVPWLVSYGFLSGEGCILLRFLIYSCLPHQDLASRM